MTPWEPEPLFEGRVVAIVAGGPSATDAIIESIRSSGIASIAINNNYRRMPWADWLFAADMGWWLAHSDAREFMGLRVCSQETAEERGLHIFLPRDKGEGRNSALHAAYAAIQAKAREIRLYGVDLRDDELTHWHGEHMPALRQIRSDDFPRARSAWCRLAARVDRPPIFNCSARSALTCFPFCDG